MKFLVIFIVLFFSAYSQTLYALEGCEGWRQSNLVGDKFVCFDSPSSAAHTYCLEFMKSTPATQYSIENFKDGSKFIYGDNAHWINVFFYDCRVTQPNGWPNGDTREWGYRSGGVEFFVCKPPSKLSKTNPHLCYIECDVPLVNGVCPADEPDTCKGGQGKNPINFLTGNKLFTEVDYQTLGINQLSFIRYYNSHNNKIRTSNGGWILPEHDEAYFLERGLAGSSAVIRSTETLRQNPNPFASMRPGQTPDPDGELRDVFLNREKPLGAMNSVWRNNFDKALYRDNQNLITIRLYRPDGNEYLFDRTDITNSQYRPRNMEDTGPEQILVTSTEYIYVMSNLDIEHYDLEGKFTRLVKKNGYEQNLNYDENDFLIEVADNLGRSLSFINDDKGRVVKLITPEGYEYRYDYLNANGLISRVYYPDGDSEPLNNLARRYVYEDVRFPNAVTGIYDDTTRYGTFAYEDSGKAIYSELAGAAEGYSVNYGVAGQTVVTNALGKNSIYHYDSLNNLVEIEGEPSTNCAGDSRDFTYDSNNFKTSETDKNGNITTYINDGLGREISRTEASGTAFARMITTEWHPLLNVKTKVTEPERITHYTYDANGLLLNQTVSPVAP